MFPAAFQPINFNQVPGTHPPNYLIRDFRKIRAELAEIKQEVLHQGQTDDVSKKITTWLEVFESAFITDATKDSDLKPLLQTSILLMHRLLTCALSGCSIREGDVVLGNDGWLYSQKALAEHQATLTEPYKNRSPLDPENPTPFTATPHRLANFMACWLSSQYEPDTPLRLPSTTPIDMENDLLKRLRSRNARREAREQRKAERPARQVQFERELRARVEKEMERHQAVLTQIADEQRTQLEETEVMIETLSDQAQTAVERFHQAIEELKEERLRLGQETARLKEQLQEMDGKITTLEKSMIELNIAINELHQKISEREEERNSALLVTVLVVVAFIIINKILPGSGTALASAAKGSAAAGSSAAAASSVGIGTIPTLGSAKIGLAPVAGGGTIGSYWVPPLLK